MCFSFLVGIVLARVLYHSEMLFVCSAPHLRMWICLTRSNREKKHISYLLSHPINAYMSEEHQLHFSFMSPLFLPHCFVRPPLTQDFPLHRCHRCRCCRIYMRLISASCVYDVVDGYKAKEMGKNYKTTQVESTSGSTQSRMAIVPHKNLFI